MKPVWFLSLAAALGLALFSSLSVPVAAEEPPTVDLVLGGTGAVPWAIGNVVPGDSGISTVTLSNIGSQAGMVTIWISNISNTEGANPESETGNTAEPGELSAYLTLTASGANLSTVNFSLPATIDDFPHNASDTKHIYINYLPAGGTIDLDWEWRLPPATGNDVQGDILSFTINYMLEELPPLPTPTPTPTATPRPGGGGGYNPPEETPIQIPTSTPASTVIPAVTPAPTSTSTPSPASTSTPAPTATTTPISPEQLFDITVTLDDSVLEESSDLTVRTRFESFGTVPTWVDLTFIVLDESGQEVYRTQDGITVETEFNYWKEFSGLKLVPGYYVMVVNTLYNDNVSDEFRQDFSVQAKGSAFPWYYVVAALEVIGAAALVFFIIFIMMRRRNRRSRT